MGLKILKALTGTRIRQNDEISCIELTSTSGMIKISNKAAKAMGVTTKDKVVIAPAEDDSIVIFASQKQGAIISPDMTITDATSWKTLGGNSKNIVTYLLSETGVESDAEGEDVVAFTLTKSGVRDKQVRTKSKDKAASNTATDSVETADVNSTTASMVDEL